MSIPRQRSPRSRDGVLRTPGGHIDLRAYDARARMLRGAAFVSAARKLFAAAVAGAAALGHDRLRGHVAQARIVMGRPRAAQPCRGS